MLLGTRYWKRARNLGFLALILVVFGRIRVWLGFFTWCFVWGLGSVVRRITLDPAGVGACVWIAVGSCSCCWCDWDCRVSSRSFFKFSSWISSYVWLLTYFNLWMRDLKLRYIEVLSLNKSIKLSILRRRARFLCYF